MKPVLYFNDDLDTSFGKDDLMLLSQNAKEVFVIGHKPRGGYPSHVHFIDKLEDWKNFSAKKLLVKYFLLFVKILFRFRVKKWIYFKGALQMLVSNYYRFQQLEKFLIKNKIDPNRAIFYSFWSYDLTFLSFVKMRYSSAKIISRAHGGDLYEDSPTLLLRPWLRKFEWNYIDQVYAVSVAGLKHLQLNHPEYRSKFILNYLGSKPPFDSKDQLEADRDILQVVSVAHIRDIKKVHRIGEALLHWKGKVVWHHFGEENAMQKEAGSIAFQKIKQKLKDSHVHLIIHGNVGAERVHQFYLSQSLHAFISLSITEGLPVSMMEAQSYGVPIISTDVGGCKEIVTPETGILLSENPTAEEVNSAISEIISPPWTLPSKRQKIREFWEKNFNQEKNFQAFFYQLQAT